ncbi:hydrogenase maturation factor HypB-like [Nymphalis io]|uniref:hydrogenase maturation factor HypB-like n=1 Tax=Inachis io TaxID=171585 RepID=UPI002169283C|nr:hydrogenase maturation factor HypB-like [Nymphalis io]
MYRLLSLCFILGIIHHTSGFYNHFPQYGHGFYPHDYGYHHHSHQHDDDYDHQDHYHHSDSDEDDHHQNEDCDYGGHHHPQEESNSEEIEKFIEVVNKYVEADTSFKNFCYNYSQVSPLITYGRNACVFKYLLPGNGVFKVEVRIMKQILGVSVMALTGDSKTNLFKDMRVLPDILNINQADWSVSKRHLKITIPYKVPLMTEFSAECDIFNNDIIIVPSKSVSKFEYRMGE